MSQITRILSDLKTDDPQASARLLPLVYEELRMLARQRMAQERGNHTLQATALVHEAYVRLLGNESPSWANRAHFFAAAAEAMRRILVDHARRKNALCHGGGVIHIEADDQIAATIVLRDGPDDVIALSDALDRLSREDPGKADLVKLRYFAGLNLDEAAAALGISRATAHRHWTFARAWLFNIITGDRA